jgi:hypothetical protein
MRAARGLADCISGIHVILDVEWHGAWVTCMCVLPR